LQLVGDLQAELAPGAEQLDGESLLRLRAEQVLAIRDVAE
jgi:hypothetical protein